ncbi:hydantoinase B/oxoprolinase family protein [Gracilimonas mengyeensis]|uniref:5-oxoprolinase (ATP-hydrolysing) n=1 Tax=Gracilimonas mengyeensis TaxID=1302730 RepID=A0A521C5K8_9BACT|nr:hydantoinase B/oxoprolinase family protein [Gracilimonas mengyeensis]SMO54698.1 5-oxoprolinase (ATP-hydrolysing) [Gracilimonas mengyeensis]
MWHIYVDTGGTFTDCLGIDPKGNWHRTKVLSNSTLRGYITEKTASDRYKISQDWKAPSGFIDDLQLHLLGTSQRYTVSDFDAESSSCSFDEPLPEDLDLPAAFEISFEEEPPILASRLITQTPPKDPLPPINLRLGTTRGTNALLEHKGAPVVLFTTEGFKDLPVIGNQQRPDLFSLQIEKPIPIYQEIIEVNERLDANGEVLRSPDMEQLREQLAQVQKEDQLSAAVCLMHSYKNDTHEQQIVSFLEDEGIGYVSVSSQLSPFIKILPRLQTTLVNAYLSPVLRDYLSSVRDSIQEGSLHVMTSAGGLVTSDNFNPKDSLLSGPAGGVVGAAAIGKASGFSQVISFDMGGTSSDVSRYDGNYDYVFEHKVGETTLSAPALSVETVASGGGSVCWFDGKTLKVGPESGGASPGPACYGAGGPLTVTDVNLLLGRLTPDNFGIPLDKKAAEKKFQEIQKEVEAAGLASGEKELLEGFINIANERMAGAIRKISQQKGYDCTEYALVAFGGAGGQHACAIARELGMKHILLPADAGILSAYGMGQASIEQFAEQQFLDPLSQVQANIEETIEQLAQEAMNNLEEQNTGSLEKTISRRLVFMRLQGQESTLEIEYDTPDRLFDQFKKAYKERYGHWIEGREVEVESVRVVASTLPPEQEENEVSSQSSSPETNKTTRVLFNNQWKETPVFSRDDLQPGHQIHGPALIPDRFGTVVLEPHWEAKVESNGTLKLSYTGKSNTSTRFSNEAVALELFTQRFTSIAEEMGEMLRRTALSVNVKERLDFSCALLNSSGDLMVNAPHIPVHLGALGLCVKEVMKKFEQLEDGDVIVTNHPAYGGSHLPDVTVITPIFVDDELLGFAASRAHHAEIGGTRPGSMPPFATSLAEEGVVIPPMYLVKKGEHRWKAIREHLTQAQYPTRSIDENMADLQAAVAANQRGREALVQLAQKHGTQRLRHFMDGILDYASEQMRTMLREMDDQSLSATETLDDGTEIHVSITIEDEQAMIDFEGTSPVHPGNMNCTPAIVNSVVMYVLRLLLDQPLPLNEGLLGPVTIKLPKCFLNPDFPEDPAECPAVVGGNIETSQRLTDTLLKPFEVMACSQGTMNNVLFGNDDFGYYETIGGGTGAGPDFDGADAVHHHMTNTAATDPEILEHRYPVRLDRYAVRENSGGKGSHSGGNGLIRELTFMKPVSLSVLTQHRKNAPYALQGGKDGEKGKQWIIRENGEKEEMESVDGAELEAGEKFILHTPGGGGFGAF